jgi:hypothetical protein
MMGWVLAALLLALATSLLGHRLMALSFRKKTEALITGLKRATEQTLPAPEVPAIIRAYARRAAPASSRPRTVRLWQRGEMRFKPGGPWQPMLAEQVMSVREAGFVWLAEVRVAPFLFARVVDAYVGDHGLLEARLLGSVPLARATGPHADKGELMRYLAELVWAPQAMLENPWLRWREVSGSVVEVTAASSSGPARVRLVFGGGDVIRVEADDRPHGQSASAVPRRWIGRFHDYREVSGYCIPTRAEVAWVLDDGPFTYWRGEVTDLQVA